jgi:hypothetical protein
MLIGQITLLVLALEGLLSWCWLSTPAEVEVFAFANLSLLAGIGVAGWLRTRPTLITLKGGAHSYRAAEPPEINLKKAA